MARISLSYADTFKHALLLSLVVVSFFSLVSHANAQTTAIAESELTAANGWTCTGEVGVGNRECTKAGTNDKATCQEFVDGRGISQRPCSVTVNGVTTTTSDDGAKERSITTDAAGNTEVGERPSPSANCSIIDNLGQCLVNALSWSMSMIVGGLSLVVLQISSYFLGLVGQLFNLVVIKTVFQFGQYFGASEGMLIAWRILRDIGNIVLLFGFIFMGIATILNTHAVDEFSARRALPRLIIFAVLLNFSLFASQLVIDVSNSFAAVFTAQAGYDCVKNSADEASAKECENVGIAGNVIQLSGVATIWSGDKIKGFLQHAEQHAPVYLGLSIFLVITMVVLLAASIMLVIRAVVLCLLMVTSPIGFAGMAIPPLQEFANKWWKSLLSNAFFAPIYLLMVLISLKIVEGLAGNQSTTFADQLIGGGENAPQIFVIFAVVIGFMIASLAVAKSMGAAGASYATSTAGKLVGGATLGTVGFAGRRTIGVGSAKAASMVRSSNFGKTEMGRMVATTFDKGAHSSFDLRMNKAVAGAAKKGNLDLGKPSKSAQHGIHKIEEDQIKKRTEYAGTLAKTQTEAEKTEQKRHEQRLKDSKDTWKKRKKDLDADATNLRTKISDIESGAAKRRLEEDLAETKQSRDEIARTEGVNSDNYKAAAKAMADLETQLRELPETAKKAAADLKTVEETRATEMKKNAEEVKAIERDIGMTKPEFRYADNIEHPTNPLDKVIDRVSLGGHIKHEAADKIKKGTTKTAMDKALDTIRDENKKKGGDDAEGHGDDDKDDHKDHGGDDGHAHDPHKK